MRTSSNAGVWDDDDHRHMIGPDMRHGDPALDLPNGYHRIILRIEQVGS